MLCNGRLRSAAASKGGIAHAVHSRALSAADQAKVDKFFEPRGGGGATAAKGERRLLRPGEKEMRSRISWGMTWTLLHEVCAGASNDRTAEEVEERVAALRELIDW